MSIEEIGKIDPNKMLFWHVENLEDFKKFSKEVYSRIPLKEDDFDKTCDQVESILKRIKDEVGADKLALQNEAINLYTEISFPEEIERIEAEKKLSKDSI